jgi:hypothetical protein
MTVSVGNPVMPMLFELASIAFSSDEETGSREENASKQESKAQF